MPQMMPMLWSFMLISLNLTILFMISFFYFMNSPQMISLSPKKIIFHKWPWLW